MNVQNANFKPIDKQFIRYVIPSVIGMTVQALYTVLDGIVVGQGIGEIGLAAISLLSGDKELIPAKILKLVVFTSLLPLLSVNSVLLLPVLPQPVSENTITAASIALTAFLNLRFIVKSSSK